MPTDRPDRYAKQLAAHLGRRIGGRWDEEQRHGHIEMDDGSTALRAQDGCLVLEIEASAAALDRLEDVVGRHLVRFGANDGLVVRWIRTEGA